MIGASRAPLLDNDALAVLRPVGERARTSSGTDTSVPAWELGRNGQIISRLQSAFTVLVVVPSMLFSAGADVRIRVLVAPTSDMVAAAEIGCTVITAPDAYRIVCEIPPAELARGQQSGLHIATRCEISGIASVIYSAHLIPGP